MKFLVEVPTYLKIEVDAHDATDAAAAAQDWVAQREQLDLLHGGTLMTYYGEAREAHLVLLPEGEDRDPDVYLCRGGKLNQVMPDGSLDALGENCFP